MCARYVARLMVVSVKAMSVDQGPSRGSERKKGGAVRAVDAEGK